MDHRKRIKFAIEHKEADKIPIDFGGTPVTSIATIAYGKLRNRLGLGNKIPRTYDFIEQLALIDEDIMKLFYSDTINISNAYLKDETDWCEFIINYDGTKSLIPKFIYDLYDIEIDNNLTVFLKDKRGTILAKMPKDSVHFNQTYYPYEKFNKIPYTFKDYDLKNFMWALPLPGHHLDINDRNQFELLINGIKELFTKTDYAIVFGMGCGLFGEGASLRGFENFLIDICSDKKGVKRLIDKLIDRNIRYIDRIIKGIGKYVNVLYFPDDLGLQTGLFISPEAYRDIFKSGHKKMWDYIHSESDCKVFLHSCGSLYELIPDLIDAGIDILNPVQTNAAKMEPERLKKEFGKYLTFWGGGCDTRTLALKKPKEVREEVKRRVDIFGKDGGFIFASIHNITAEVCPENIIAMFEAANEC